MKHLFTNLFETKDQLSEQDSKRGSRLLVTEGVFAMHKLTAVKEEG